MGRGGARPGAGRKAGSLYPKTVAFRVSEATEAAYRQLKGAGVDIREEFEIMIRKLSRIVLGV